MALQLTELSSLYLIFSRRGQKLIKI